MAGLKAIRRRIATVQNTRQITRAMKLVSAAKLRRAEEAVEHGAMFTGKLKQMMQQLMASLQEDFSDPLLESSRGELRRRLVIVVGGDRGLCGAYNVNLSKVVLAGESEDNVQRSYVTIGKRISAAAKKFSWPVVRQLEGLPEDINKWPIADLAKDLATAMRQRRYDEAVVYYSSFESAVRQYVTRTILLPISIEKVVGEAGEQNEQKEVKCSPPPAELFSRLLPLYVTSRIRQIGFEARASEHAARMTAMDSATRNAGELIDKLQLFYNRARQGAITKELLDIIGGADAVK